MTDLLHIDGKPYVLVPMHEYRRLMQAANAGGAAAETLPDSVMDDLLTRVAHPVKILRKHRGMTQSDLAAQAGLSRPYLTEIETGKKQGSIDALRALAAALDVDIGLLLD